MYMWAILLGTSQLDPLTLHTLHRVFPTVMYVRLFPQNGEAAAQHVGRVFATKFTSRT